MSADEFFAAKNDDNDFKDWMAILGLMFLTYAIVIAVYIITIELTFKLGYRTWLLF